LLLSAAISRAAIRQGYECGNGRRFEANYQKAQFLWMVELARHLFCPKFDYRDAHSALCSTLCFYLSRASPESRFVCRIVGVEYVITPKLFETLSDEVSNENRAAIHDQVCRRRAKEVVEDLNLPFRGLLLSEAYFSPHTFKCTTHFARLFVGSLPSLSFIRTTWPVG
jgi:hypothetical protein